MALFWTVIAFCAFILGTETYKSGAPPGVCQHMTPKHGNAKPQTNESPYDFSVSPKNNEYEVIVKAPPGDFLRGFVIQAREEHNPEKIIKGEFTESPESRLVNCADGGNFLTHTSNSNKTELITTWRPSSNIDGNFIFRATLLRTAKMFWTNIDTAPLPIMKRQDFGGASTATPSESAGQGTNMLGDCGIDRSCFGMPENCKGMSDCSVSLTYVYDPSTDTVEFQILSTTGSSTNMWIAAGLSENNLMGDDSVADCILNNGEVSFHYSWNQRRGNDIIQGGLRDIEILDTSFADGILSCRWRRSAQTLENGISFNLVDTNYYILLAKGPLRSNTPVVKEQHSERLATSVKVNFTSISIIRGSSDVAVLIKVHGCMMTIAWVGLVSIGILLARHYKDVFVF